MSGFLKRALGVFVEFDDKEKATESSPAAASGGNTASAAATAAYTPSAAPVSLREEDIDKFEKHFDKLMQDANLPGPDYFEFDKMMDTLEAAVPDEKARVTAVFAALGVQGLTKEKLVDSAKAYMGIVQKDKDSFTAAADAKAKVELQGRKDMSAQLEKTIADHSAMINKLTQEIKEHQAKIKVLKDEIETTETKLVTAKQGYLMACDAMLSKINQDIQKIQTSL
jgi:chromosome segregation ATPase